MVLWNALIINLSIKMSLAVVPPQSCALKESTMNRVNFLDPETLKLLPRVTDINRSVFHTQIEGPLSNSIGLSPLLIELHLKKCRVCPVILAIIAKTFVHLTTLRVTKDCLDGESFKELAQLTSLRHLELNTCRVKSQGIQELSRLKNLQILEFESTPLDNRRLINLTSLTQLGTFKADDCRINKVGMNAIAQLTGLTCLSLANNDLDDVQLESLAHLTNLTILDLSQNVEIRGEGLASLPCGTLKTLLLMECLLEEGGVFVKMTNLTALHLNSHFSHLHHLTALTKLSLLTHQSEFDDEDFDNLGKMRSLIYLDLAGGFFKLNHADSFKNFASLIHLVHLNLNGIHFEGEEYSASNLEESLALTTALTQLKHLVELSLTLGTFNKAIANNLKTLNKLKTFTLILKGMRIDGGIAKLLQGIKITTYKLEDCELVGQAKFHLQHLNEES